MNWTNGRRRVLIVDDDPALRAVLCEMLEAMWYECGSAADGAEALGRLDDGYDAVLLDLGMPRMDGLEVARRIRADPRCADLPIIMVSGSTSRDVRSEARETGIDSFISKPVHWTELRVRLERVGEAQPRVPRTSVDGSP